MSRVFTVFQVSLFQAGQREDMSELIEVTAAIASRTGVTIFLVELCIVFISGINDASE